jgi:HK97 family phage major capsid protein
MAKKLQELATEIATKTNQVNELFDLADKRTGDQQGVNTKEEIKQIVDLNKELEDLEAAAAELKTVEDIRRGNSDRLTNLGTINPTVPHPRGGDGAQLKPFKSLGELIVGDENFSQWLKQWEGGRFPSGKSQIQSPRVDIGACLPPRMEDALKTLITGAGSTSAGPLVFPDFKPLQDVFYARPLTVRDIITVGETGSDTVEYVRITGVTNNAAPTAEATATTGSSGEKPESAMAMARITESVKTIPHWIPATNRALADAPQLRTIIDNFLRYGIEEELEDQILTGNAAGENFDGVLHVAGTTPQAFDTNIFTTTRKGRTKVRTVGRARPTAYVMNPLDWEKVDLAQDNEARYYYGGPMNPGNPRLWGLPVVESEGMTEGTCVVADWKLAILWDRMQTAISMSNSHADFFIRNLIAILAEMRAAFGVIRPAAFVICDLTA